MKLTGLPYEEIDPNDAKITAKREANEDFKDFFLLYSIQLIIHSS
jgi:hypothetical protein